MSQAAQSGVLDTPSRPLPSVIESRLVDAGLWPLVRSIATEHYVSPRDLLSRKRFAHMSRARWHIWSALRGAPYSMSYPAIARLFGVDHASVLVGVRKHESGGGE